MTLDFVEHLGPTRPKMNVSMPTTAVLERLVLAWWTSVFGNSPVVIATHDGPPGPTDTRASTLLVWTATRWPALVSVLERGGSPAPLGLPRTLQLLEGVPPIWSNALRAVPADGPAVRTWAEHISPPITVQATGDVGRIRCTCDPAWLAGLPVALPRTDERVQIGLARPADTTRRQVRGFDRGLAPAVLKTSDGVCVSGRLRLGPERIRWTPDAWSWDRPDLIWFDADCGDEPTIEFVTIRPVARTPQGLAEWIVNEGEYGLRWTPTAPCPPLSDSHSDADDDGGPTCTLERSDSSGPPRQTADALPHPPASPPHEGQHDPNLATTMMTRDEIFAAIDDQAGPTLRLTRGASDPDDP